MRRTRCILPMVIMVIGIFILIIVITKREFNLELQYAEIKYTHEVNDITLANVSINTPTSPPITPLIHSSLPAPTPVLESKVTIPKSSGRKEQFAIITIDTDKKTKTLDIMPDVNEKKLKRNIGWLPSSVLPGQEGNCILMGHRDTDFSILQYAEIGDGITIKYNNTNFKYTVSEVEIVESDKELRFEVSTGYNLILVTCYPFRYTGHAPKKFVVYASITK